MFKYLNIEQNHFEGNYIILDLLIMDSDFIFEDHIKVNRTFRHEDVYYCCHDLDYRITDLLTKSIIKLYSDKSLNVSKNLAYFLIHMLEKYNYRLTDLPKILSFLTKEIVDFNKYLTETQNYIKILTLLK